MDTLRKCKHKNFCKYVQKFTDNLKGIQTSQFKERFLLQVQDSWDLNYMIKTTVESFHGNRSVMLKNFTTPLLFIVKEEASSSHYFLLMCIKSNLIENKTTVGLNFYTLKKTNVSRRGLLRLGPFKSHKYEIHKYLHLHETFNGFFNCCWP